MLIARDDACGQPLAQLDGLDSLLQVGDCEDGVGQRRDEVVGADPRRPIGIRQLAGLEQRKILVQDVDRGAALLDFLERLVENRRVSAGTGVHLIERVDGLAANGQQANNGRGDAELLEDGDGGGHGRCSGRRCLGPIRDAAGREREDLESCSTAQRAVVSLWRGWLEMMASISICDKLQAAKPRSAGSSPFAWLGLALEIEI